MAPLAVASPALAQGPIGGPLDPGSLLPSAPDQRELREVLHLAGVTTKQVGDGALQMAVARAQHEFKTWKPGATERIQSLLDKEGRLKPSDVAAVLEQQQSGAAITAKALDGVLASARVGEATASLARSLLVMRELRDISYPMTMEMTIGATTAVVMSKFSLVDAANAAGAFESADAAKIRAALGPYCNEMAGVTRELRKGIVMALAIGPAATVAADEWASSGTPEERELRTPYAMMHGAMIAGAPLLVALSRCVDTQIAGVAALSEALPESVAWDVSVRIVYGPQAGGPDGYQYIGPRDSGSKLPIQPKLRAIRNAYIAADFPQLRELMATIQSYRKRVATMLQPFAAGATPTLETMRQLDAAIEVMNKEPPLKDWRELHQKRQDTANEYAAQAAKAAPTSR